MLENRDLVQELSRHSSFKGDYTTLDDPVPGLARWNKDQPLRVKALELDTSQLEWSQVPAVLGAEGEHINVAEAMAHVLSLFRRVNSPLRIGSREVYLLDSGAACGAFAKGRSSSFKLNGILRCAVPYLVAGRLPLALLWVSTGANPADDPSRNAPLRPPGAVPDWLKDVLSGSEPKCKAGLEIFAGGAVITVAFVW